MHTDTLAALRQLVAALEAHPEDLPTLSCYGAMPEHLADVMDDWFEND